MGNLCCPKNSELSKISKHKINKKTKIKSEEHTSIK